MHWKTNPQRLISMSNKYSSVISHCMQSQVTDTFIHQSMYQWLDGTCILQIYHECNTRFRVFYIISWSIVNHCKYSVNYQFMIIKGIFVILQDLHLLCLRSHIMNWWRMHFAQGALSAVKVWHRQIIKWLSKSLKITNKNV